MIKLRHLIDEIYIPGFVSSKDAKPFHVPENFDLFEQGSGWSAYRGANDWESGTTGCCVYVGPESHNREQARIWFEVQYPKEISELVGKGIGSHKPEFKRIQEWGNKAVRRWMIETKKIHRLYNSRIRPTDPSDPYFMKKSWKECFIEALTSEKMKPYVKNWGIDHTKWQGMEKEITNEKMFPKDFNRNVLGSCMSAAALATDYLLQKGIENFKIVKGLVSLYPDQEKEGWYDHTWIEFENGRIFDPTKKQWKQLGVDPNEVKIEKINKKYTPNEYQRECQRQSNESLKSKINESFRQGNGWFVYEGTQRISTIFENGKQLSFELTFRNKIGEEKEKWRSQAASKWATIAREIYNNVELNEVGDPKEKSWDMCFKEALTDKRMKPYIKPNATPVFDPINFTPRV